MKETGNDDHLGANLRFVAVFDVPIVHLQLKHVGFLYGPRKGRRELDMQGYVNEPLQHGSHLLIEY